MPRFSTLRSIASILVVSSVAIAAEIDWRGSQYVHLVNAWDGEAVPGPADFVRIPSQPEFDGFAFVLHPDHPLDVSALQVDPRATWWAISDGAFDTPHLQAETLSLDGVTNAMMSDLYVNAGSLRQYGIEPMLEISDAKIDLSDVLAVESGLVRLRGGAEVSSPRVNVDTGARLKLDSDARLNVERLSYDSTLPLQTAGRLQLSGDDSSMINAAVEVTHGLASDHEQPGLFVSGGFLRCQERVSIGSGVVPEGGRKAELQVYGGGTVRMESTLELDHAYLRPNAESDLIVQGSITAQSSRIDVSGLLVTEAQMRLKDSSTNVYGAIHSTELLDIDGGTLGCIGSAHIGSSHIICGGTLMFRECEMRSNTVPETPFVSAGTFERGGTLLIRNPKNAVPGMVRELVSAHEITGAWDSVTFQSFDDASHVSMELAETDQSISLRFDSKTTGDVDGDGHVSFDDLLAILLNWDETAVPSRFWRHPADVDAGGRVDVVDLLIVLEHYGN
jgi:hypothetical protein